MDRLTIVEEGKITLRNDWVDIEEHVKKIVHELHWELVHLRAIENDDLYECYTSIREILSDIHSAIMVLDVVDLPGRDEEMWLHYAASAACSRAMVLQEEFDAHLTSAESLSSSMLPEPERSLQYMLARHESVLIVQCAIQAAEALLSICQKILGSGGLEEVTYTMASRTFWRELERE